jgi:pimeloyl-ACP methyl ester carboxylesterase
MATHPGTGAAKPAEVTAVTVPAGDVSLSGDLVLPDNAAAVVVFAHGSGSGRHSPRNRQVAEALNDAGLGTLLLDLLTAAEERIDLITAEYRFDIALLGGRVIAAIDWVDGRLAHLDIGLFGASTGAAAALVAAADRQDVVGAVVSRGGRPDLAGPALERVTAPTLLIVGEADPQVLELNTLALDRLGSRERRLVVVPGATHLFEEPGALEEVAGLAADWFTSHLAGHAEGADGHQGQHSS